MGRKKEDQKDLDFVISYFGLNSLGLEYYPKLNEPSSLQADGLENETVLQGVRLI